MWTICTDVKLPSVWFVLLLLVQQDILALYAGGTWSMDRSGANEDTYPMLVISRLITVTYLPIFHFRQWRPAKPSTGMSFDFPFFIMDYAASEPSSELCFQQVSNHCTVFAI